MDQSTTDQRLRAMDHISDEEEAVRFARAALLSASLDTGKLRELADQLQAEHDIW